MTARLVIDQTHVARHVTGMERVALGLFDPAALAPHPVTAVRATGLAGMIALQQSGFLLQGLRDRGAWFMFPGFPPSPLSCLLGDRCLMYVHDIFPLSRPGDLSRKAALYIAPSFGWAVRRLRHFFVNSRATGAELRPVCRPGALIALLRPAVADVFGVAGRARPTHRAAGPLRVLAIGTIEPRKNYPAAIAIVGELNRIGVPAELHVVGRPGWGDHPWIASRPDWVRLHGYVDDAQLRALVASSDLFLTTSHAEGLGLPPLEVQHGGLAVAAPDAAVFTETLAQSAILFDPANIADAAQLLRRAAAQPGGFAAAGAASRANVARWNALARLDAGLFRRFLAEGAGVYRSQPDAIVG